MEAPSTVTCHQQAQPSQPPCRWQGPPPPSAFTPVNTALVIAQAVLASSSVFLLGVLPALPPSTSQPQPPPPAWTALLARPPLALPLLLKQTVLPVLLAVMLQQLEMSAAPALMASTSPALAPPPAWGVLLA
jgi:hypothetical protein